MLTSHIISRHTWKASDLMRFAIFLPQKDFKDETASLIKLIMEKWGVGIDMVSYGKGCIGTHGAMYKTDVNMSSLPIEKYDGIVLVDGKGIDDTKIYDYRPLLETIMRFDQNKKAVISVGNAGKIVARANIIKGRKMAVPDTDTMKMVTLFSGIPSKNSHEIAGNLITIKDSDSIENSSDAILQYLGVM